ncbi:hypothetical protein HND97_16005 [Vibrio cholerae]|nr:hypothetical protein HND97_16005 [Vibrio cholerae]
MKLTFSSLGLLLLVSAPSFALTRKQGDLYWQIDPDTLAISLKQDSQSFAINQGSLQIDGQRRQATQLTQSSEQTTWTLKPSGVQVSAQLQQGLNIDFAGQVLVRLNAKLLKHCAGLISVKHRPKRCYCRLTKECECRPITRLGHVI